MQISHDALSNSSAFDVYFNATVGFFVNIETASVGSLASTVTIASDLKSVEWYIPRFSLANSTFTCSFVVRVQQWVYPNTQNIVTNVLVLGDSYPLVAYNFIGRTFTTSSVSAPLLLDIPSYSMANTISSVPSTTGNNLVIDEVTTVEANVTMAECTSDLKVFVQLPIILKMVAFQAVVTYGANVVCSNPVQVFTDTNADNVVDMITLTFGTCVNAWDNVANDDDKIYIRYVIAPIDVPANIQGVTPMPMSTLQYGDGALVTPFATIAQSVVFNILEPTLFSHPIVSSRLILSDAGDQV